MDAGGNDGNHISVASANDGDEETDPVDVDQEKDEAGKGEEGEESRAEFKEGANKEIDDGVVEEANHLLDEMFKDVEVKGKVDLLDEPGIGFEDFCRFDNATGDEGPDEIAGGEKWDVLVEALMEEAAENQA